MKTFLFLPPEKIIMSREANTHTHKFVKDLTKVCEFCMIEDQIGGTLQLSDAMSDLYGMRKKKVFALYQKSVEMDRYIYFFLNYIASCHMTRS